MASNSTRPSTSRTSSFSTKLRSVEARFLDCLSNADSYYKKHNRSHQSAKKDARNASSSDASPVKPVSEPASVPAPAPASASASFNVSSVRRMRKIEDDYDSVDEDAEVEENFPTVPVSVERAQARQSLTSLPGPPKPVRSASRASYSNSLPYGARRVNRNSWSTLDFQEYMNGEREREHMSRTNSLAGSMSNFPIDGFKKGSPSGTQSPMQRLSKTSKSDIPSPLRQPRSIIDADVPSRPLSRSGSTPPTPSSPGRKHQRVYSDFADHSVAEENDTPSISAAVAQTAVKAA